MKKTHKKPILFITTITILLNIQNTYCLRDKSTLFQPIQIQFSEEKIKTNPKALLAAAQYGLRYFQSTWKRDRDLVKSSVLESSIINAQDAEKTLKFIVNTIKEDLSHGNNKFRILNSAFLKKHFTFIKWFGDQEEAKRNKVTIPIWPDGGTLAPGKIKLTNYAVFRIPGSYKKTYEYPHALYEITDYYFDETVRFRYSKQTIVNRMLEQPSFHGKVKPLVWVSRKGLESALMQGSAIVRLSGGKEKIFNVHKSNGMIYDKMIKNPYDQKKYWFFKEIKDIDGKNGGAHLKIIKLGGVAFAGDLKNLGLGKFIALRYQNPISRENEIRLGVLADRGNAFSNNLYQLDLFAGIFDNKIQFKHNINKLPNTVNAYLLKVK